jgi:uncharacterized protein YdcH (DUF465 family)
MGKSKLQEAQDHYQKLSDEFTELNKEYNRAERTDELTDELELKFLKAEKALHAAYADQQAAKMKKDD